MKKNKPKIKKYPSGGHFFDQAGQLALNGLRSTIDVPLTTLGLSNVVPDSAYTGLGAEFGSNYSNKVGGALNKIAPMAANMLLPGAGTAISGAQNVAGQFNPQMNYDPNAPKQYAMGGVAELEKQEVFKMPNGQIDAVNGAPHSQGGVPVNIPNQTKILSDKLKLDGKTFAKLGAKFTTTKEDKVLSNDMATAESKLTAKLKSDIKQKKLDELFAVQEQMKQSKLNKYAEKLGIQLPQTNSQFANQGMQEFEDGGTYGNLTAQQAYDRDRNRIINANEPGLAPIYKNSLDESINYNQTDVVPEDMGNFAPSINEMDWSQNTNAPMNKSWIEPLASGVLQNAGNLAYLANEGRKYDKVDYGKITPKLIDYSQSLKDARMQAAISRNQTRANSGGNAGAYLANQGQLGAQNTANISNIIQAGENANAGIYNQAQQANQEYKIKGMVDEAANKGAAYSNYYKALSSTGENTSQAYMDYKKGKMDYKTVLMLNQLSSKYGWDLNNKGDFELATKALAGK